MSDLIERLREYEKWWRHRLPTSTRGDLLTEIIPVWNEAADELERLTAELERLTKIIAETPQWDGSTWRIGGEGTKP